VAMLALLAYALKVVTSTPSDRATGVLLGGSLGPYAGWAAGAVWLNLASVLPSDARGDRALLAAVLVAAALTCVSGALFVNGTAAVVIGASWACAGICLSAAMTGARGLAAMAAAGLLATLAAGSLTRRPHRTTTDPLRLSVTPGPRSRMRDAETRARDRWLGDVPVQVGLPRRFVAAFFSARADVAAGRLGRLRTVRSTTFGSLVPPEAYPAVGRRFPVLPSRPGARPPGRGSAADRRIYP
jgi:hypothetical protein